MPEAQDPALREIPSGAEVESASLGNGGTTHNERETPNRHKPPSSSPHNPSTKSSLNVKQADVPATAISPPTPTSALILTKATAPEEKKEKVSRENFVVNISWHLISEIPAT